MTRERIASGTASWIDVLPVAKNVIMAAPATVRATTAVARSRASATPT
jgi:hypothetical protein